MRAMRALSVAALLLAACGGGDAARLRAATDELCACTDPACIAAARGELADLDHDLAARGAVPDEPAKLGADAAACEAKAWALIEKDDPAVVRLGKVRDQVCACTDAACVARAQHDLDDLGAALDARFGAQASERATPPMMALGADIARCVSIAVVGAPSGTPR
jgi:hypothetical protein